MNEQAREQYELTLIDVLVEGLDIAPASARDEEFVERRRAWLEMRETWNALDAWEAPPPRPQLRERILAGARKETRRRARHRILYLATPLAAAAAVAILIGGFLLPGSPPAGPTAPASGFRLLPEGGEAGALRPGATVAAGPLAPVTVVCPDASRLTLDPGGRMELLAAADNAEPRFRLREGRVAVRVGPDASAQTPFRLLLPDGGYVEDLGTAFTAEILDGGVEVIVREGTVRFVPEAGALAQVLRAGDRVATVPAAVKPVEADPLDPAMRARLAALKEKAERVEGEDWVEAIREMADITDDPPAQAEVLRYLAGRIASRDAAPVEVQEMNKALRHRPRPPVEAEVVETLIAKANGSHDRTRRAAVSALGACGTAEAIAALEDLQKRTPADRLVAAALRTAREVAAEKEVPARLRKE